jgi:membrane protease YdiL (CAAX protease family)
MIEELARDVVEAAPLPPFLLGAIAAGSALFTIPLARIILRRVGPAPLADLPDAPPRWGLLHIVFAGFWTFVIADLLGSLFPDAGILARLWMMVGILSSTTLLALLIALRLQADGGAALGFRPSGIPRAVTAGILVYLVLVPALFGLEMMWPHLAPWVGIEVVDQAVLREILELEGEGLLQAALIAVVIAPFFEEAVFRGFLQPFLVHRLGAAAGLVATSLLFALLHGLAPLLPLFALSLVLGVVRLRTGHLAAAWAVHALHNGWTLWFALHFGGGT